MTPMLDKEVLELLRQSDCSVSSVAVIFKLFETVANLTEALVLVSARVAQLEARVGREPEPPVARLDAWSGWPKS